MSIKFAALLLQTLFLKGVDITKTRNIFATARYALLLIINAETFYSTMFSSKSMYSTFKVHFIVLKELKMLTFIRMWYVDEIFQTSLNCSSDATESGNC